MNALDKFLAQCREKIKAENARCSVCLSPVIHHSSKEGTQFYECTESALPVLVEMVEKARVELAQIQNSSCARGGDWYHSEWASKTLAELNALAGGKKLA